MGEFWMIGLPNQGFLTYEIYKEFYPITRAFNYANRVYETLCKR